MKSFWHLKLELLRSNTLGFQIFQLLYLIYLYCLSFFHHYENSMKYVDIIEECNYNSEFELDVMFQLIFLLVKILFSSYEMSGIVHW
jgi:hypothetical protein